MPSTTRTRPILHMTINGAELPRELKESVLQVVVEESLHLPSVFTVALVNPFKPGDMGNDFPIMGFVNDTLEIGAPVTIGFSNTQTSLEQFEAQDYMDTRLIVGEITALEVPFSKRAQSPIVIRGYSYSHRLHRGRWNRAFENTTDSDIAVRIAGEAGIPLGQIDDSSIIHEHIFQENQTNMEFLRERAARIGFEVFVQEDLFYFRRPSGELIDEGTIDWLNYTLDNIRIRSNSIEQIKEVEVRGWDYPNKLPFIANRASQSGSVITDIPEQGTGEEKSAIFQPAEQTFYVVDQPVYQQVEADFIAQSCCDEIRGQYIHIDIEAEGDPRIRPGRTINVNKGNFPEKFRGTYYITETRHLYEPDRERTYNTEFVVRGLRNSDLLTTLSPPNRLQPGQTFLIGIVTANMDPLNLRRIRVMYPTLTEEYESHWARMVTFGAGEDRGIDWLPEINDEVILAFEHGDIHRPLIIGSAWNGVDVPPEYIADAVESGAASASELTSSLLGVNNLGEDSGEVRLRTLRTREGQQIQFIDKTKQKEEKPDISEKGIRIATLLNGDDGAHKVYLNDESHYISMDTDGNHHIYLKHRSSAGDFKGQKPEEGDYIEIKTAGDNFVRLDDEGKYIEIKTAGGHQIKMDDQSKTIDIVSIGNINMKAPQTINIDGTQAVNITSQGPVTVQGKPIRLN